VREREASTLGQLQAQGVDTNTLILGKGMALLSVVGLLLIPLLPGLGLAMNGGESLIAAAVFLMTYLLYLAVWVGVILLISILNKTRSLALALLFACWVVFCLVIPSMGTGVASMMSPTEGKIETDFRLLEAKKEHGDGHDSTDPAFKQLKQDTLAKYGVDRIEDLPVNWRGIVSAYAEKKDGEIINTFAEKRMSAEAKQSNIISTFGWLSPSLAFSDASRKLAGSDLLTHHRFLREAEAIRIAFIQAINEVHIEKLDYEDDMNRNKDEAASKKARVDSKNWDLLQSFQFVPDPISTRVERATMPMLVLASWIIVLLFSIFSFGRRLKP
jgi:ABC-2 type transport system permease protein